MIAPRTFYRTAATAMSGPPYEICEADDPRPKDRIIQGGQYLSDETAKRWGLWDYLYGPEAKAVRLDEPGIEDKAVRLEGAQQKAPMFPPEIRRS